MQRRKVSQFREGENQRSDHAFIRRDDNNGRVRDFATLRYQLHDQQRSEDNGKDIVKPKNEIQCQEEIQQVIRQRDGKTSEHAEVRLGRNKERYPVQGGTKKHVDAYWATLNQVEKELLRSFRDNVKSLKDNGYDEVKAIDISKKDHPNAYRIYERMSEEMAREDE